MPGRSKLDNWGWADIHIYVLTHYKKKQSISKEINCAEHEYMNISPSIIEVATALECNDNILWFHCHNCIFAQNMSDGYMSSQRDI